MSELSLRRDGVMRVSYSPELKEAVDHAAAMWRAFCALPEAEKMKLSTTNNFNGSGYEFKVGNTVSGDRKENFDVSWSGLGSLLDTPNISTGARDFIKSTAGLAELASEAITEVGSALPAPWLPELNHKKLAKKSAELAFFRFLHYPSGAPEGAVIAEPHTDHSGITLHLSESTAGCEKLSFNKSTWEPLPVAHGEAIAFGGMQAQLASHGEVNALCHRVVANETSAAMGRFAIVCFTPLKGWPAYDKATHGRLQEKQPGFNYDMHHDEFSEYFVH